MIKTHLARFLQDSEPVRDLLGENIFPLRALQGAKFPYALLQRLGGRSFNDLPGEDACTLVIMDVSVYSEGDTQSTEISEAIRNRLSGYSGPMGDVTCFGCAVQSPPAEIAIRRNNTGGDDWVFVSSVTYQIVHSQSVPTHI